MSINNGAKTSNGPNIYLFFRWHEYCSSPQYNCILNDLQTPLLLFGLVSNVASRGTHAKKLCMCTKEMVEGRIERGLESRTSGMYKGRRERAIHIVEQGKIWFIGEEVGVQAVEGQLSDIAWSIRVSPIKWREGRRFKISETICITAQKARRLRGSNRACPNLLCTDVCGSAKDNGGGAITSCSRASRDRGSCRKSRGMVSRREGSAIRDGGRMSHCAGGDRDSRGSTRAAAVAVVKAAKRRLRTGGGGLWGSLRA